MRAYGGVVKVEYDLSNAFEWVLDHFAELSLLSRGRPVSALIVLLGLGFSGWASTAAERAFVAVATSTFVLVVAPGRDLRLALLAEDRGAKHVLPRAAALPGSGALALARTASPARRDGDRGSRARCCPADPAARQLLNIGILSDTFGLIPLYRLVSRP